MPDWANPHVRQLRKQVEDYMKEALPYEISAYDQMSAMVRDTLTAYGVDITNPQILFALWLWTGVFWTQAARSLIGCHEREHMQAHLDMSTLLVGGLLREATRNIPEVPPA